MKKIIGTIISLKNLLENKDTDVKIDMGRGVDESVICLKSDRIYVVPSFQRELRWEKRQVIEIIRDIQNADKFLGNMIFNKKDNNYFEIIDGQQRMIVIYMILDFLRNTNGEDQDIFSKCQLKLQNFDAYNLFVDSEYGLKSDSHINKDKILEKDFYGQSQKFQELYKLIKETEYLNTKCKALKFYDNLCRSTFNIIVSNDDGTNNAGIEYFLDVNLKGLKLDDEDIFKGYLFSLDNSEEMILKWNDIKRLIFEINKEKKEIKYNLCNFLQHFLYCYLYDNEKYQNIEFGNDFLIEKNVEIDNEKHFIGEHIVKVIWSKKFFIEMLSEAKVILEIINDIIRNPIGLSDTLKKYLEIADIDTTEYPVINNYIAKILLDDKLIFKSLIIKYLRSLIKLNSTLSKKEKNKIVHEIYAIVLFIGLYLLFNYKKDIKKILPILKEANIHDKLVKSIKDYLSYKIAIDFTVEDNEQSQKYMSKILASLYNFYYIDDNDVKIRNSKYTELKRFLDDIDEYSVEHFLINDSNSYEIQVSDKPFKFKYPVEIWKKFTNCIFNYIFIPKQLNNDLNDFDIHRKIKILENSKSDITCDYSNNYINIAKTVFQDLSTILKSTDMDKDQMRYFTFDFIQNFNEFKGLLVQSIIDKLNSDI